MAEKVARRLRETDRKLANIRADRVMIKQERATYEAKVQNKFHIIERSSEMIQPIVKGFQKMCRLQEDYKPKLVEFLDEVSVKMAEIERCSERRAKNFGAPLIL